MINNNVYIRALVLQYIDRYERGGAYQRYGYIHRTGEFGRPRPGTSGRDRYDWWIETAWYPVFHDVTNEYIGNYQSGTFVPRRP